MAKTTQQEKQEQKLIGELLMDYDGPESFWDESGLFVVREEKMDSCVRRNDIFFRSFSCPFRGQILYSG